MKKKELKFPKGTKAYWEFKVKVYTSNPAKATIEQIESMKQVLLKIPETVGIEIEEKY